jgi:hypothetical protein
MPPNHDGSSKAGTIRIGWIGHKQWTRTHRSSAVRFHSFSKLWVVTVFIRLRKAATCLWPSSMGTYEQYVKHVRLRWSSWMSVFGGKRSSLSFQAICRKRRMTAAWALLVHMAKSIAPSGASLGVTELINLEIWPATCFLEVSDNTPSYAEACPACAHWTAERVDSFQLSPVYRYECCQAYLGAMELFNLEI